MSSKKATVTVRRPSGVVEEVETKYSRLTDALFRDMAHATRRAGRGELVSYANPEPATTVIKLECGGCKAEVDESAYSQTEQAYGMPVTAYYCSGCERLFRATGQLVDRTTGESPEPATKPDM